MRAQPDITHCAMRQPERAIFLGLMMPSIMLQGLSWVLGATALNLRSRGGSGPICAVAATVGVAACFLLSMGESVLDPQPNWTIHVLGASGFFLLSMGAEVAFSCALTANKNKKNDDDDNDDTPVR